MEDKKIVDETVEVNDAKEAAEELVEAPAEEVAEASAEEAAEEAPAEEASEEEAAEEAFEEETAEEKTEEETPIPTGSCQSLNEAIATREEVEERKKAVKEQPIIKKKKRLDKTNVIVIAVCAVIVLACLAFVAFKVGWIKVPKKAKIEVDNYSTIEILKSDVEVTDETVQQYITNILQTQVQTEPVTEGVVAEGDQLNIDYVGKLKETGEAFGGGSAEGQLLTIGSGAFIPGFETALIGAPIGGKTSIEVTFPDPYTNNPAMSGKAAIFDVTINSKMVAIQPELSDEFVHEYSHNYLEKELTTVAELEEYVYNYIYEYKLHTAIYAQLAPLTKVTSYDEEKEALLTAYAREELDYYAALYGVPADQYAQMSGFESADTYAVQQAHAYLDTIMLVDRIIKDKKVTWEDTDLDVALAVYIARSGLGQQYSLEEFKETRGETWMYLYENLEFKFNLAMQAMQEHVTFVDERKSDVPIEVVTQPQE